MPTDTSANAFHPCPLPNAFDRGVASLCRQIHTLAAMKVPNGWVPVPEYAASNNLAGIKEDYFSGGVFPVSEAHSDDTIYPQKRTNYALRAWHDAEHARGDLPLDVHGEISVAAIQVGKINGRVEKAILFAEVAGQAIYNHVFDEFPKKQSRFSKRLALLILDAHAKRNESHRFLLGLAQSVSWEYALYGAGHPAK